MKKVIHNPSKCIGCMACVGIAPQLFQVNEETGLAKLINGELEMIDGEETGNLVRLCTDDEVPEILASACCGGAITVEDIDETN